MSLPTSLNTPTTEGTGEKITLIDSGMGVCYVNANVQGDTAMIAAIKDFLQFAYSDSVLRWFTESTGCARPLKYTMQNSNLSNMSGFYQDLWDLRTEGKVVYFSADNSIFRNYSKNFAVNLECAAFAPRYSNTSYNNFYTPLEQVDGCSAAALVKSASISQGTWNTYKN